MAQPVSDEALQLRKRARRRLVGAIALVAIVVLVVPWFIDTAPPPPLKDVEIVIPPVPPADKQFPPAPETAAPDAAPASSDAGAQAPAAPADPAPAPAEAAVSPSGSGSAGAPEAPAAEAPVARPEPTPPATARPAEKPVEKPADKRVEKRADKPAEKPHDKPKATPPAKPATTAIPPSKGHVIQLGAYSDRENATQLLSKLRAAGLPGYVEPVKTPDGTKTRVRCGPFATPEAAQAARAKLVSKQIGSGDLKVVQAGQ